MEDNSIFVTLEEAFESLRNGNPILPSEFLHIWATRFNMTYEQVKGFEIEKKDNKLVSIKTIFDTDYEKTN